MYSPERDFAYNYPRMISCIIRCFNTEFWPELLQVLGANYPGGPDALWEELCETKDRYCEFLSTCCQDPNEKQPADVLIRSGFMQKSPLAQIAWMAMLGQVVTGQIFQGLRDITPSGQQRSKVVELMISAKSAAEALNKTSDKYSAEQDKQFEQLVLSMRESGLNQQQIRDKLSAVFNREADIA
jgi:hypothetical protein